MHYLVSKVNLLENENFRELLHLVLGKFPVNLRDLRDTRVCATLLRAEVKSARIAWGKK